jgi:hypothetical protein
MVSSNKNGFIRIAIYSLTICFIFSVSLLAIKNPPNNIFVSTVKKSKIEKNFIPFQKINTITLNSQSSKYHDLKTIYPWKEDPHCQHFVVQVFYKF